MCGLVAQWIRHLTTNQGIPGSNLYNDKKGKYLNDLHVISNTGRGKLQRK